MSDWAWYLTLLTTNGALLWSCRMKYRFGVGDGAFNQSLPHVQRAMLWFDEDRARKLLREKGIPLYIGAADPLGEQHDARGRT